MIPALILARGGSKGILGKNLQELGGMTLVGRCVAEAVKSRMDPVYVWSDSEEIRAEGAKWGARTPGRPGELSGDRISTEDTTRAFLSQEDPRGAFSAVAVLQATTPFMKAKHLDQAVHLYEHRDLDSVVSATRFGRFLGYPSHNGRTDFIPVRPYRALRQADGPPIWMENGGIYLAASRIWNQGKRIGAACGVVEMDWWESLEIDDPRDLEVARQLAGLFLETPTAGGCLVEPPEMELLAPQPLKWIEHG